MEWVLLPAVLFALPFVLSFGWILTGFGKRPPEGLDWIIVLGAKLNDDGPCRTLRLRLDAAAACLKRNPACACVVSGGQGPDEPASEASAMRLYLMEQGIDRDRILVEDRSSNTRENLALSLALLPEDPGKTAIVTSDFHMSRSLFLARAAGLKEVYGLAAPSVRAYLPFYLLRETLSFVKDLVLTGILYIRFTRHTEEDQ